MAHVAHERGIGWALRKVRREQDRTLEDVAACIGSDAGNLSRIERGEQNVPEDTLRAVARELGVRVSDLWVLAESGDERMVRAVALMGQLDSQHLHDLARYAEYLLSRQAQH